MKVSFGGEEAPSYDSETILLYCAGEKVFSSPLLFAAPSLNIFLTSVMFIVFGATLAFGLTLSEFMLVNHTSGCAQKEEEEEGETMEMQAV